MTTSHQIPRGRGRIAAAAMLAASGALVAGALGPAAAADAPVNFIALAYHLNSPPVGGVGISTSENGARAAAIQICDNNGGSARFCEVQIVVQGGCVALAERVTDGVLSLETGADRIVQGAESRALARNGGGRIVVSGCVDTVGKGQVPRTGEGQTRQ